MKITLITILFLFTFYQCMRDKPELLYSHGSIHLNIVNGNGDNLLDPDLKKYNPETIYVRYSSNELRGACSEIIDENEIVIFLNWDKAEGRVPSENNFIYVELDQSDTDTISFDFQKKFWNNISFNGKIIEAMPTDVVEIVAVKP